MLAERVWMKVSEAVWTLLTVSTINGKVKTCNNSTTLLIPLPMIIIHKFINLSLSCRVEVQVICLWSKVFMLYFFIMLWLHVSWWLNTLYLLLLMAILISRFHTGCSFLNATGNDIAIFITFWQSYCRGIGWKCLCLKSLIWQWFLFGLEFFIQTVLRDTVDLVVLVEVI